MLGVLELLSLSVSQLARPPQMVERFPPPLLRDPPYVLYLGVGVHRFDLVLGYIGLIELHTLPKKEVLLVEGLHGLGPALEFRVQCCYLRSQ